MRRHMDGEVGVDRILHGDALTTLRTLPAESVHCVITSPPYWGQRDYGVPGQLGLEQTPADYLASMVAVFAEVRRVLRRDGTLWLNMGDGYANDTKWGGSSSGKNTTSAAGGYQGQRARRDHSAAGLKPKDLVGMPWMLAFALREDGWYLRSDIIWHKPNAMPESVRDRPSMDHEHVFLLTKAPRYYYDADAIREPHRSLNRPPGNTSRIFLDRDPHHHSGEKRRPGQEQSYHAAGRNKRTVWTIATSPYKGAHFATFPPALVEPCLLAGCPAGGVVLDPFMGAGTVGVVARRHSRHYLGIELSAQYIALAEARIAAEIQPALWSA